MPLLEARCLVKTFGRRMVVKGVDIRLESGEIIGFLGRNGAGKTTIFQMIVGLLKPDGGEILLDGKNISSWTTDRRAGAGLTYLPQENSIFLKASVADNLRLALELLPYAKSERGPAAQALLDEFGLSSLAGQSAHSLSGGERRRLEIARALTLQPKFLLLDEPFTGIDPLTILEIQKILRRLRDRGIGILLSDHNVRDTFRIVDRAYVIDEGEILIEDAPEKVAADPNARKKFLGTEFAFGEERVESTLRGIPERITREDFFPPLDGKEEAPEIRFGDGSIPSLPAAPATSEISDDEEPRQRLGILRKSAAVLFDFLFVGALWFVSFWLASLLLATDTLMLIKAAKIPAGLFLAVLLGCYFFLSLFFLGKTFGDRIASPRE